MPISKKLKKIMDFSHLTSNLFKFTDNSSICDFTIGNPTIEPPLEFVDKLKHVINNPLVGMHRYTPIAGYNEAREAIAKTVSCERGTSFSSHHVIITAGASGALNVILKAILDPGEEVIILAPFFVDYLHYIDNHGGICQIVETNPDFTINIDNIAVKINSNTKAILINSPNNPTGEVYSEKSLTILSELLVKRSQAFGKILYLISDEAHRSIIYDDIKFPNIFKIYENTILATSYSKQLSIPGERIGYALVNPKCKDVKSLMDAMTFASRILGFQNASALMQRVIINFNGSNIDISEYKKRRDVLCNALKNFNFSFLLPKGTFFVFPKSPVDDYEFAQALSKEGILIIPGSCFGRPGYFRISFCVKMETIEKSLEGFKKVKTYFDNI